jgi:hypothetical protein
MAPAFVALDELIILITVMTSKASQDAAEQIVIPRGDMPAACRALERGPHSLQPRQRVFCPIDQHGHLSPKRLTGHSVFAIVQTRMRRLGHRRCKTRRDAKAAAALFSGHSLRGGDATSAAAKELAELPHSGPHSPQIDGYCAGYIRESNRWGKSGLKGGRVLAPCPHAIVSKDKEPAGEQRGTRPPSNVKSV